MAITSKKINLSQLDKELGGQGLVADFNDETKKLIQPADNSTITEKELEDAIKAHVAIDDAKVQATAKAALLSKLGITAEEAVLLLS